MNNYLELIELYKIESKNVIDSIKSAEICKFVELIISAYHNEKKIFACGNGGNAAFVGNLVTDLNLHPFVSENKSDSANVIRNKFHAVNLCDSPTTITGITNDFGFNSVFKEQLKYQASTGDILFCISGSGNSKNILTALEYAHSVGMICIIITRNNECQAKQYCELLIEVPGISTFPGQTGGNNNNFHFEDFISKLSHIATGILKKEVQND